MRILLPEVDTDGPAAEASESQTRALKKTNRCLVATNATTNSGRF